MKKIIFGLALMAGVLTTAQSCCKGQMKDNAEMKEMRTERHAKHMEDMKKELGLSDAQVTKINALHEEQQTKREAERAKMDAERTARMEAMKQEREAMDAKMSKILTPEQYTKWQEMKKDRMEEGRGRMMKGRRGDCPMNAPKETVETSQS